MWHESSWAYVNTNMDVGKGHRADSHTDNTIWGTHMNDMMAKVIQLTRADKNALPLVGKTTKLGEEFGELCEAVLLMEGLIRYKETIGTPLEEGADIMLVVLDILSSCYPNHSPERLVADLGDMVATKTKKWQTYMG